MAFWRDIADKLGNKDDLLGSLDQSQCEAIIDALNLLVYADGQETVLERAELEHLIHELPWALSEGKKASAYLEQSAHKIKRASERGEQGLGEIAVEVADRIKGVKLRKRTLKMAAAVAYSDWHAGPLEHFALLTLAEAFEIPKPFAQAIITDMENDAHGVTFLDDNTEPELVPIAAEHTIRDVISTSFLSGFFDELFDNDDLKHLDREEAMAFIDALAIALVSDGYPEQEELNEFKTQIEKLPFSAEDTARVQLRVESCLHTIRATPDRELDAFIGQVAAKISSPRLKERALTMGIHITHADFDITREEHIMLKRIARGFGVDERRLNALILDIKEDTEEGFIIS
jgi:uncharacterized tellurite resistance protein B-like protein